MSEAIAGVGYLAGLCGHTGTDWQKLPMLWGYSNQFSEDLGGEATGAYYQKGSSSPPAGEIWIVQAIAVREMARDGTNALLYIEYAAGHTLSLNFAATLTRYYPLLVTGAFVLKTGDDAWVYIAGTQVGDVIEAAVCGYKMRLDL